MNYIYNLCKINTPYVDKCIHSLRLDEQWITINGTPIQIDENGYLQGEIGKEIQRNEIAKKHGITESEDRGKPSETGEMKTAIVYHGSNAEFDNFDPSEIGDKNQVNQFGEGFYFTDDPSIARNYGDNVYAVELQYSTDRRTAKRTGGQRDFMYNADTGYWVIPQASSGNIRILERNKVT